MSLRFDATVNNESKIQVPAELTRELPPGTHVRVVLVDEDEEWLDYGRRNLARLYSPEDATYDELNDEPPAR